MALELKQEVFIAVCLSCCALTCDVASGADSSRPNLVFLMTDNQRVDALGCYGNKVIQTPNIDALAAEGVRFTRAYCTTSICAASRASIFTGQYRRMHGYTFHQPAMTVAAMRNSYPAILKHSGYRTGFVGKTGVELADGAADIMFDFYRPTQAASRREPYYVKTDDGATKHLTRVNGDYAIEFLAGCEQQQPFCLSVSFSAPHPEDDNPVQYVYDRDLEKLCENTTIPLPSVHEQRYFDRLPEFIRVSMNRERWFRRFDTPEKYQLMMKGMYRLITGVDIQVGRILSQLEKQGMRENTVIIFTSDNGLMTGEHGLTGIWLMYEPSIRLPLVIVDPRIPKSRRGKTVSEFALNIDYAPTLLELAGIAIPACLQGQSLVPLIRGDSENWRQEFLHEHFFRPRGNQTNKGNIPRSEGIRTKDWKYIFYFDETPTHEQLFDLTRDPHEVNNLAQDPRYRGKLDELRGRLNVLRDEAGPAWKPARRR